TGSQSAGVPVGEAVDPAAHPGKTGRPGRRASPMSSLLGQPEILPAQFSLLSLALCPISLPAKEPFLPPGLLPDLSHFIAGPLKSRRCREVPAPGESGRKTPDTA